MGPNDQGCWKIETKEQIVFYGIAEGQCESPPKCFSVHASHNSYLFAKGNTDTIDQLYFSQVHIIRENGYHQQ